MYIYIYNVYKYTYIYREREKVRYIGIPSMYMRYLEIPLGKQQSLRDTWRYTRNNGIPSMRMKYIDTVGKITVHSDTYFDMHWEH